MKKFQVCVPYVCCNYYDIEAETKEEAIDKAFKENDIPSHISLCYQCAEEIDSDLEIDNSGVYAEELK